MKITNVPIPIIQGFLHNLFIFAIMLFLFFITFYLLSSYQSISLSTYLPHFLLLASLLFDYQYSSATLLPVNIFAFIILTTTSM